MMLENAGKGVLRSPVKTLLFLLLLIAATAFLCLGIGMWTSSNQLYEDADRTYTTVAYIEYMGENYPDANNYDQQMIEDLENYDSTPLFNSDAIVRWDRQLLFGGTIEQLVTGTRGTQMFSDIGVVLLKVYYNNSDGITCIIMGDPLYAVSSYYDGVSVKLDFSEIDLNMDPTSTIKPGELYLMHGRFYVGDKRIQYFAPTACTLNVPEAYKRLAATPIWNVTDIPDYQEQDLYQKFRSIARTYRTLSNQLTVRMTDFVESGLEFYLDETSLLEGRFFTEGEGATDPHVCIISRYLSEELGIGIGDTLPMELYNARAGRSIETSYWYEDGYIANNDYTVVGIFENLSSLYTTVYIPYTNAEWLPERSIDYTIGRVQLKNDQVEAYLDEVDPYLLGPMRVSVYDEGYSRVREAIDALHQTAVILTLVCGACTLVLLILFGFLCVVKQRRTAYTMICLGAGKKRTFFYLFYYTLLILALAALLGSILGILLSDKLTVSAYQSTLADMEMDYRFSSLAVKGYAIVNTIMPEVNPLYSLLVFGIVMTAGCLINAIFCASTVRSFRAMSRRHKVNPLKQGDRTTFAGYRRHLGARIAFPFRMVFRSIVRSGPRSFVIPLVSLVMMLFVGMFGNELAGYSDQLKTVYERIPVNAYMASVSGKIYDGLILTEDDVQPIINSGFVRKINYTTRTFYLYEGVSARADGSDGSLTPISIPTKGFAVETFADMVRRQPSIVGTNNIATAPEFYFEGDVTFQFADGYDASIFDTDEKVCLVNTKFMELHDIQLGDTLQFMAFGDTTDSTVSAESLSLTVVGTYPSILGRQTVYCPLKTLQDTRLCCVFEPVINNWMLHYSDVNAAERLGLTLELAEEVEGDMLFYRGPTGTIYYSYRMIPKYRAISYSLQNTDQLNAFKDYLTDIGYTSAGTLGRIRRTVIISETELVRTVQNLTRHIGYMRVLFVAIYLLASGIGFILSFLLTKNRRPEFAMMRSMGSGKGRTFFTFVLEQGLLFLCGLCGGIAILLLILPAMSSTILYSLLGYAVCYLLGIVIAAATMNRLNILQTLSTKE